MIAPLAPAQPPLGAGAHVMPRYYLYKKHSAFFAKKGNTALSQPGRHSGGAKPLERQVNLNDFYRTIFLRQSFYQQ
jgi:hypothetical protein